MHNSTLRPYQTESLDQYLENCKKGIKKSLLHLPTGAGKTTVFCEAIKRTYQRGNPAIMVVHGIKLVDQASARLTRENVRHGVLQGNHWKSDPRALVQICSITTLYKRKHAPPASLVVIDEAHMANSPSFKWLAEQYPDAFFMPVSATPHTKNGLEHIADRVIKPITHQELIDQGFLLPARYMAPSKIDLSNVKYDSRKGDYQTASLISELNKQPNLFGDMITHYKKHSLDRPALAFAVDINHSKELKERFNSAGIPTEHIDASTPLVKRDAIIAELERGNLSVITSVGTMTTGVDIPCLHTLIIARPTASYNLHIQILGRGTRPYLGLSSFLVLDHAGNLAEHGFIEDERECLLEGIPKRNTGPAAWRCEECFGLNPINKPECQQCGAPRPVNASPATRQAIEEDDELIEISGSVEVAIKARARLNELKDIQKKKGYKRGWVFYTLSNEYGEKIAQKLIPKRKVPAWIKRKA